MIRTRSSRAAVGILLTGGMLTVLAAGSASAAHAGDFPQSIAFDESALTFEYGEYWFFALTADAMFGTIHANGGTTVSASGVPLGFVPELYLYEAAGIARGNLSAPYDRAPLGVGSYTFRVSGTHASGGDTWHGETTAPAQLTIAPTALGTEVRILADPGNPDNAIVTVRFTGRFVDEYQSSFYPASGVSPGGIWKVTITDQEDEVVLERSIERAAGNDVLATSFYWPDADPETQYTAKASFTPSGASDANFEVRASGEFAFTSATAQRPEPVSSATPAPIDSLPEETGFALPLWSMIAMGVIAAGLVALVTVFSVRLSKTRGLMKEVVSNVRS